MNERQYVNAIEQSKYFDKEQVGEITVSYENVTVTYRLTFDTKMQLAGLFIR